jgi:hypothetical protein
VTHPSCLSPPPRPCSLHGPRVPAGSVRGAGRAGRCPAAVLVLLVPGLVPLALQHLPPSALLQHHLLRLPALPAGLPPPWREPAHQGHPPQPRQRNTAEARSPQTLTLAALL